MISIRKYIIVLSVLVVSCSQDQTALPHFTLHDNQEIGIDFSNDLVSTNEFNVYKYRNFYNGGGVALGDINNDNLLDIYFVSNQSTNKLYLNKGDFQFEEITESAGVGGQRAWSTGVTIVDINADGWNDIYVCNSGDLKGDNKENELFINNGDGTFTEQASKYNLNDKGYSTHATFFDYDRDGDLDVYILNNSYTAIGSFNLTKNQRPIRDELGGDKLMENRKGKFFDVSDRAGIYGSEIGFGLGVTVSDFNNDSWDDIFISNDFFERDYLYINQKDKTYKEVLTDQMHSISAASMGADAADIDNDGYTDVFVTDMLPSEYERLKTVTTFDDWNRYYKNLVNGYHHQFTRNMLHKNNGNESFSELARFAGVEASDWSWGALLFDMDNDGLKDLFIANGIYRDLTNQDYLQYIANESVMKSIINDDGVNYKELIDIIPSNKVNNHAYLNVGKFQFARAPESGLELPSFSNGSAYGDLDNDGDYDLVVNNINMPSFVFENNQNDNNYIKLILEGKDANLSAVGAKVKVSTGEETILFESYPAKGFQSSIDPRPNIGVGQAQAVDIEIIWPDGSVSAMAGVPVNQTVTAKQSEAIKAKNEEDSQDFIFLQEKGKLDYLKSENKYVDFNRERLIYHMRSNEGAGMSVGDLNGDGQNDIVIPGAKGFATKIFLQSDIGNFLNTNETTLEGLKESEHVNSALLDVDGDGDLDLYLASGGVEHSEFSAHLLDHLLINDGSGNFSLSDHKLPVAETKMSTKAIASADIDGDGDLDMFVGERVKIGKYGARCSGKILVNDGKGIFTDMTKEVSSELDNVGMITDAKFSDVDNDGDADLVICGEFMDVLFLENVNGKLERKQINTDVALKGWWNVLKIIDIEQDGDMDILAGNHGLNSRFSASEELPLKLYYSDFDNNRFPEGIVTFTSEDGKDYPYALRHNLIDQIKSLKKNYPDFESFKEADIASIFSKEQLEGADVSIANQLKSVLLINDGNWKFSSAELPEEVQYSCIYAIDAQDYDRDGDTDLLMGGNLYNVVPEMGIYDASYGHYLTNDGKGKFKSESDGSGFFVKGEIRDIKSWDDCVMVQVSGDSLITYKY